MYNVSAQHASFEGFESSALSLIRTISYCLFITNCLIKMWMHTVLIQCEGLLAAGEGCLLLSGKRCRIRVLEIQKNSVLGLKWNVCQRGITLMTVCSGGQTPHDITGSGGKKTNRGVRMREKLANRLLDPHSPMNPMSTPSFHSRVTSHAPESVTCAKSLAILCFETSN